MFVSSERNPRKNLNWKSLDQSKVCCCFTFSPDPTAKLDHPPWRSPLWLLYLLFSMIYFTSIDAETQIHPKQNLKLSAIFFHKYAIEHDDYCAWSVSMFSTRDPCGVAVAIMADEVNNIEKLDERKVVSEFCRLLEKSRVLFNSLRYYLV